MQQIENEFKKRFGDDYIWVRSPGRVNLIGEHTDYNEGFVLPAAVDKSIFLAMAVNKMDAFRFYAVDKEEFFEIGCHGDLMKSDLGWPNYLLGVIDQLRGRGYDVGGFDCVFGGNVPMGAGMSSSAALEGGVLYGLVHLFGWDIAPVEMARIAQKAENEFVGVQCGIMDQFVSLNGKKDHAMKLDCRSLDYEFYPFAREDVFIVLCDTRIRRELASSEYNIRREQCEKGVKALSKVDSDISSLRDVHIDFLNEHRSLLKPVVFNRCKYVVEENVRVLKACKDLEDQDLVAFGRRMYASHEGLRDEYEVSCPELDVLVEEAAKIDGVLGARMMGGGFGGCTINLVKEEKFARFKEIIQNHYLERTGKTVKLYRTKVSGGTHLIETNKYPQV